MDLLPKTCQMRLLQEDVERQHRLNIMSVERAISITNDREAITLRMEDIGHVPSLERVI